METQQHSWQRVGWGGWCWELFSHCRNWGGTLKARARELQFYGWMSWKKFGRIRYIYTIKMKKNNSVVKDKYFEFTCRVVFFCIHQIGHTLFHVLFSSIFWETCLNLPQLTCRVCGSGHDSLEKGGNFRHQTTPSCSTSRVKQETQGVKSKINTGTSNFRTPRTLKFG